MKMHGARQRLRLLLLNWFSFCELDSTILSLYCPISGSTLSLVITSFKKNSASTHLLKPHFYAAIQC
jgi:hypothetical protein